MDKLDSGSSPEWRGCGVGWWFIGYSTRSGFRGKPGMTWVWDWVVV